jgi:hypothetical protein
MTTYAIDTENSITAHATKQEAGDGSKTIVFWIAR